jgi:phosphatidylglycerol:prolipoprotein diacylglycerol transferase
MYPLLSIGPLVIPTYYLLISLASLLGVMWFLKRTPGSEEALAINTAFIGLIAGFAGARLFHVVYEEPMYYARDVRHVFEFWKGGFVYYGGLIVGMSVAVSYLKKRALSVSPWLDRASLPLGLAYAVGRIGCFFNGCCYGRICEMPWAIRFPSHISFGMALLPRHPTQLYAAFLELLIVSILLFLEHNNRFKVKGQLFWTWLSLHAVNRLIMEAWRDDDRGAMIFGVSISTYLSCGLLALALYRIFQNRLLRKRVPV